MNKKVILIQKFLMIILMFMIIITNSVGKVQAETPVSGKGTEALDDIVYVASPGFFTGTEVRSEKACELLLAQAEEKQKADLSAEKIQEMKGEAGKDAKPTTSPENDSLASDAMSSIAFSGLSVFIDPDIENGKANSGVLGLNCNKVSAMNLMGVIFKPVNITNNEVIVKLITPFQIIAGGIATVLVSVYALMMLFGYAQKVSLGSFLVRTGVVLFAIVYLPYLLQDILNLNNILVNTISESGFSGGSLLSEFIVTMMVSIAKSFLSMAIFTKMNIWLFLIFAILAVVEILKPIVKVIIWWYARLIMIIFYAAIGPLFVVFSMIPEVADFSRKWFQGFLSNVFSQSFVTVAAFVVATLLGDTYKLANQLDVSWLIMWMLMPIVAMKLLASSIDMSEKVFGSGIGGIGSKGMSELMNAGAGAVAGAGAALAHKAGGKAEKSTLKSFGGDKGKFDDFMKAAEKRNNMMAGVMGMDPKIGGAKIADMNREFGKMAAEGAQSLDMDKKDDKGTALEAADQALDAVSMLIGDEENGAIMDPKTGEMTEAQGSLFSDADDIAQANQTIDKSVDGVNEAFNAMKEGLEGVPALELKAGDTEDEMNKKIDDFSSAYGEAIKGQENESAMKAEMAEAVMGAKKDTAKVANAKQNNLAKAQSAQKQMMNAKNDAKRAINSNPNLTSSQKAIASKKIDERFGKLESKMNGAAVKAGVTIAGTASGMDAKDRIKAAVSGINSTYSNDADGAKRDLIFQGEASALSESIESLGNSKESAVEAVSAILIGAGMDDEASKNSALDIVNQIESSGTSEFNSSVLDSLNEGDELGNNRLTDEIYGATNDYAQNIEAVNENISNFNERFADEVGENAASEVTTAIVNDALSNAEDNSGQKVTLKTPEIKKETNEEKA